MHCIPTECSLDSRCICSPRPLSCLQPGKTAPSEEDLCNASPLVALGNAAGFMPRCALERMPLGPATTSRARRRGARRPSLPAPRPSRYSCDRRGGMEFLRQAAGRLQPGQRLRGGSPPLVRSVSYSNMPRYRLHEAPGQRVPAWSGRASRGGASGHAASKHHVREKVEVHGARPAAGRLSMQV